MKRVDEHLTHDGLAEISVRLLDQRRIQVFALLAQERDFVLAAAAALDLTRIGEEQPRLADEIQRNVGEPQILLERRRMADPFAEPLSEHQAEIAETQHIPVQQTRDIGRGRAHRVLTSSGMS